MKRKIMDWLINRAREKKLFYYYPFFRCMECGSGFLEADIMGKAGSYKDGVCPNCKSGRNYKEIIVLRDFEFLYFAFRIIIGK